MMTIIVLKEEVYFSFSYQKKSDKFDRYVYCGTKDKRLVLKLILCFICH